MTYNTLGAVLVGGCRRLCRTNHIALAYHIVGAPGLSHVTHLFGYKTPEQFEQDLIYLIEHGRVVNYEQLAGATASRTRLPKNAFHISFDDGYAEVFSVVRPLLLKYEVPCTFFITTDFLDNRSLFHRNAISLCIDRIESLDDDRLIGLIEAVHRRFDGHLSDRASLVKWLKALYAAPNSLLEHIQAELGIDTDGFLRSHRPYMSVDQVRQLASEGFTIGAHSVSHPRFQGLSRPDEIEQQMAESCRVIRDLVGCCDVPFAIPFNGSGISRDLLETIRSRYPFIGVVFDTTGLQADRPFMVNRVLADRPAHATRCRSNLPYLLLRSYASAAARSVSIES